MNELMIDQMYKRMTEDAEKTNTINEVVSTLEANEQKLIELYEYGYSNSALEDAIWQDIEIASDGRLSDDSAKIQVLSRIVARYNTRISHYDDDDDTLSRGQLETISDLYADLKFMKT
jgi:hypothetical protein